MLSITFYWLFWGIWIIVAFLMDKSLLRTQLMFGLLVMLILTGVPIEILGFTFNATWFVLLFWAYGMYLTLPMFSMLTLMFSNLSITLCYVMIRIYWLMDPAIFLILDKWVFTLILTGMVMLIIKPFWWRLSTITIGICQGDILQSIIFYPYDKIIGESDCLNSLTISVFFILGWSSIYYITQKAQSTLSKQASHRL